MDHSSSDQKTDGGKALVMQTAITPGAIPLHNYPIWIIPPGL